MNLIGKIKRHFDIDARLAKLGFEKCKGEDAECRSFACYRRYIKKYDFYQRLDIYRKETGRHLIFSYEEGINNDGFNNGVGLTKEEIQLAIRKLKQMKRRYRW